MDLKRNHKHSSYPSALDLPVDLSQAAVTVTATAVITVFKKNCTILSKAIQVLTFRQERTEFNSKLINGCRILNFFPNWMRTPK